MNLKKILADHDLWLKNEGGARANLQDANLQDANLRGANLRGADLRRADLRGANLRDADLRGANLRGANLRDANLWDANLWGADLRGADLRRADLRGANLRGANLRDANLDMSSGIPFSCKGTKLIGCDRLFSQMMYHLTRQSWNGLSDHNKQFLGSIPKEVLNSFCNYRDDLEEV